MSEPLDLFAAPAATKPAADNQPAAPMTQEQREKIRSLFASLGVTKAQDQFDLVQVLIGVHLRTVTDLNMKNAGLLIARLRGRVQSHSRSSTGNAWDDREEDTWIDRL